MKIKISLGLLTVAMFMGCGPDNSATLPANPATQPVEIAPPSTNGPGASNKSKNGGETQTLGRPRK